MTPLKFRLPLTMPKTIQERTLLWNEVYCRGEFSCSKNAKVSLTGRCTSLIKNILLGIPSYVQKMNQGERSLGSDNLTKAEFEGRKQVLLLADFLKEWISGFEKASILSRGAQIGILNRHLLQIRSTYLTYQTSLYRINAGHFSWVGVRPQYCA
jgi:hypothetical protein